MEFYASSIDSIFKFLQTGWWATTLTKMEGYMSGITLLSNYCQTIPNKLFKCLETSGETPFSL